MQQATTTRHDTILFARKESSVPRSKTSGRVPLGRNHHDIVRNERSMRNRSNKIFGPSSDLTQNGHDQYEM